MDTSARAPQCSERGAAIPLELQSVDLEEPRLHVSGLVVLARLGRCSPSPSSASFSSRDGLGCPSSSYLGNQRVSWRPPPRTSDTHGGTMRVAAHLRVQIVNVWTQP